MAIYINMEGTETIVASSNISLFKKYAGAAVNNTANANSFSGEYRDCNLGMPNDLKISTSLYKSTQTPLNEKRNTEMNGLSFMVPIYKADSRMEK